MQLSNIPWRKQGIKYANNEAYFDCIEEIDAIIDKNGATVMCEIQGYVSFQPSWIPDEWKFEYLRVLVYSKRSTAASS